MSEVILSAEKRIGVGKSFVRKLRKDGKIPGVVYGAKNEPSAITVNKLELARLLRHEHSIINVNIDGVEEQAVIRAIQVHPLTGALLHIDFMRVVAGQELTITVPPFDPFTDVPPTRSGDEYTRWDLSAVSTWTPPDIQMPTHPLRSKIVAGVNFIWENGESDTSRDFSPGSTGPYIPMPFYDKRRTIGLFGEVEEKIGDWITASGSLRYDTTPDENDQLSPATGLAIEVPRTPITLFGNYGEGFKRPSFYALGSPVGNTALRPEKSKGWEIGARAHGLDGRLHGQLSYFDVRVKDLIDFNAATFRLENRQRLISRGVEFELGWQVLDWIDFRGGLTYNHTDFENNSADPLNRPRWRGFGAIVVEPTDSLEFTLRVLAVGSSKASSFQTNGRVDTLAGYERVDVRAAWTAREWLDLFVEIENLTNETPREAVGFESPGIFPRAGMTLRL